MTYFIPAVSISDKKMKKVILGPRAETLMIIRQFARVYEYEPERKSKIKKEFVN